MGAVLSGEHVDSAALLSDTIGSLAGPPAGVLEIPERPGVTAEWPEWVHPDVTAALRRQGIDQPWHHQARAAELAHAGQDLVLATGTASGKSLAYWLPALSAVADRGTTLYCTPTKALAQDQLSRLRGLGLPWLQAATYDGDTPREARPLIRRSAAYVLTNPDMLHRSVLPGATSWASFLRRLRFVVLDEGHHYRGVFGSHMSAVVRRLRRVARSFGADPVFIITSATLADPGTTAGRLIGRPVTPVAEDASPRGRTWVILHEPDPEHTSAFSECAAALATWVGQGISSLGFVRSRSGAEAMARAVQERLAPDEAPLVTAYRGGLLPEERRDIEARLRDGRLRSVATTNALELGVDISGLDAVALCGWPGTRASFLQQIGRAGRQGGQAVALLAAQENPLDQYLIRHPDRLFGHGESGVVESGVFDPDNPYVLLPHLAAAAAELPMTTREAVADFGENASELLHVLSDRGMLRLRGDRWYWVARGRASDLTDLRGSGSPVSVVETDTARVLGTVDSAAAPAQVHEGAVYVHLGRTFTVDHLDLEGGVALVTPGDPGYSTTAQSISDLRILAEHDRHALAGGTVHFGDVEVTGQVVSFLKRRAGTGQVLGSEPLCLPERRLRTRAVWWRLDPARIAAAGLTAATVPGAAHAAEHAAIGVLPAWATCDRWDIGGVSTHHHPDTGEMTVFVYDGHPGGAGFARRGFERFTPWLTATWEVIRRCQCEAGCPSCVQSPKCGNGNEPLDKNGATAMLAMLLTGAPAVPASPL